MVAVLLWEIIDAETFILLDSSHCDHRNRDSRLVVFIRCTHMFRLLRRNLFLHVTSAEDARK